MRKFVFLMLGLVLLASNVFALDLSRFSGTWMRNVDGEGREITITYNEGLLRIEGLLDKAHFFATDVLSRGTIMEEGIPVSFTSGNMFDETFIITRHLRLSEMEDMPPQTSVPDEFGMISLTPIEDGTKLKIQILGTGWSTREGLLAGIQTLIFEKRE